MSRNRLQDKVNALSDLMLSIEDDHYPTAVDYLQALRMIAETAQSAIPDAVEQARAQGETWDKIGRLLGTTRQGAWDRYGKDR